MQLDGGLGLAKRCPRVNRQAQVDGGGIEGIDGRIQIDTQGFVGVQRARNADQVLGEIGIDLPRACRIGVGQRVARNRRTPKTHVVKPLGLCTQVDLDVAQGFATGQLRKGHGQKLIQATEVLDLVLASVSGHAAAKCTQRQKRHELRKHELALMHDDPSRTGAKGHKSDARRSNRDQTEMLNSANKSSTYGVLT